MERLSQGIKIRIPGEIFSVLQSWLHPVSTSLGLMCLHLEHLSGQIDSLRPGREYKVRIQAKVKVLPEDEPFTKILVDPSETASFVTVATTPSAPAPPIATAKDRKWLKVCPQLV